MKKMKKYTKLKLFVSTAFLALTTVSCDENIDPEPIISTDGYPTATFVASPTTVNEKDGVFTVKVTTDKMLTRGITFTAEQVGGTAVLHDDYDIVETTVEPFSKEATIVVKFYEDDVPEVAKTLQLKITTPSLANKYFLNPNTVFPTYNITINNYVSSNLDLTLNYDKDFLNGTTPESLCHIGYDIDFYVLDANLDDTGNYAAATGNCPEALTISPEKFPNGTYYIYHDLYENAGLPSLNTPEFTIPISVDYSRAGLTKGKFNQEAGFAFTSKAASSFDYVVTIVVKDGVYTLKNSKDATVATAKNSNKIANVIKQARLRNKK